MEIIYNILDFRLIFFASIIVSLIYMLFRLLFKGAIIIWSDPLNISLIILSFYTTGLIGYISVFEPSGEYSIIIVFILIYFIIGSIASRKCEFNTTGLSISEINQSRFCFILLLIYSFTLIFNFLFGYIPLLHGTSTRYLGGQQSRLLTWLLYSTSGYPIILFGLTEIKKIRKLCVILLLLLTTIGVLNASKGFMFSIFFWIVNYNFFLYLRLKNDNKIENKREYKIKRNSNFNLFCFSSIFLIITTPFYLLLINSDETLRDNILLFFYRLLAGFDQLIIIIANNIGLDFKGLSLLKIYTSPFLKIITNYKPKFNNIPEFLFYEVSGISDASYKTLLPNSNLIMEVIFTNGIVIGMLLLGVFSYINFYIRKKMLYKYRLKLIDLFLFNFFVMTPLWWFLSGTEFIINLILTVFIYLCINFYFNIRSINGLCKLQYKLH
jgi:hypothetical protein